MQERAILFMGDIMNETKNIVELISKGGITAVLLFILLYFGNAFISNVDKINTELTQIRIELTKIQASILTTQQVENLIDNKLKLFELKLKTEK